ncbi:MAG: hypothetical protein JJT85_00305 [Chromatiales bacterium]|nr:hypothetical protein [Chromatiales bacterium]
MKAALYAIAASLLVLVLALQYLYFSPDLSPPPAVMPAPGQAPAEFVGRDTAIAPPAADDDYCTDDEPCILSLRQLLQNTARYDGRRVLAFGVLSVGDSLTLLYEDPEAYAAGRASAAVLLGLADRRTAPDGWPLSEQEGQGVLVEGRFLTAGPGGYAGLLAEVQLVRPGAFFR